MNGRSSRASLAGALGLGAAGLLAAPTPAAEAGEKLFAACKACHAITRGDEVIMRGGRVGPDLFGVVGRQAGALDGYRNYGPDLVAAGEQGLVWTEEALVAYIADPAAFLKDRLGDSGAKSRMAFKLPKGAEDVAAYLATFPAP